MVKVVSLTLLERTERTVIITSPVKTSQRPGMGDVYGCGTNPPEYLRAP